MGARELLHQMRVAGLVLTLTPAGGLCVAPRSALTDDHRAAIRQARDELVQALQAEAAIRAWLAAIGEDDPKVIDHVLGQCAREPNLGAYFVGLTAPGAMPDNRRACRQCANLRGTICTAQPMEGKGYQPRVSVLFRCEWYAPGPNDPDRRAVPERWPGVGSGNTCRWQFTGGPR